jgi:signal transduction histidine kinase
MRHAAHDIANYLTVAVGHRQQSEKLLEKALEHARQAAQADAKMMELVKRMLTVKLSTPTGTFDLNAVAEELVGAMAAHGVYTECHRSAEPIYVAGDSLDMHRALLNLCLNARNAGSSTIVVTIGVVEKEAVMTIQDNGSGMPADIVSRMWDLPVTGDGHGHGLAIVKKTIAQHHGRVAVQSEQSGTKFTIWLPIAPT